MKNYDAYGQGWAMTHFFTFSKTRSQQLRQYPAATFLRQVPRRGRQGVRRSGRAQSGSSRLSHEGQLRDRPVKVPVHQPVIERIEPVGAAEADLIPETIAFSDVDLGWYRKESDRQRERGQRAATLERIRAKAARYANDPYAQYLLVEAENASGNAAAAEAAVDRLLAIQPGYVRAMIRKSILMSQAAAKLSGPARLERAAEARRLAIRANQADANEPLAFVAFYQSFHSIGAPVTLDALTGLEAAVGTLPANTVIRQMLVDEYASQRRWVDAIRMLLPLANELHETPLGQAAREQLERLEAELAKQQGKPAKAS